MPQTELARALGVKAPSVSSWESASKPIAPPVVRISIYAQFFATERTLADGRYRLLEVGELDPAEETRRLELEAELLAMRAASLGETLSDDELFEAGQWNPWRFPDGATVTIVCAELPEALRGNTKYADPDDPDYIDLYTYADPGTLLELHGHIRATNPRTQVNIRLADQMQPDDYATHLAILGGVDLNMATRLVLAAVRLPVEQRSFYDDDPSNAGFELHGSGKTRRWTPTLVSDHGKKVLVEDVAHYVRGPNPYNHERTFTVCNGMFGRGTYGAVRALTDANFRDRNAAFLQSRFDVNQPHSVLTRVRIAGGKVLTPDWTADDVVLHEWPAAAA
ncbi:XRE family transcriptional regulator [Asanoa siamensis]|uniref:HTH cro/C1-type domain-containing protein n=1 Tax=Asanoa siamensis TaxID=926357 RepID=A0ABQ4CM16_9ACTN|nr:XRE family transcriptional regulator [Asanoa siamensis]GIF72334.1 hypothetical protein Asi02nite_18520 [Asanoa siamensis]